MPDSNQSKLYLGSTLVGGLYLGSTPLLGVSQLESILSQLWSSGEQGVWYDPSELSAMFQDAAGTTPCYQPGQGQVDPPVGLLLDKRLGLARGPELVSNGDFATDIWWSKDTGVAITGGACVFSAVTASRGVYRSSLTQVGKCYVVTYTVVVNSGAIRPLISGSFGVSRTTSGTYMEVLSGTSGALFGLFANPSFDGAVDNVSIREVLGNHAYQATTTCRPALSARYNLLTNTEDFSVTAAWPTEATGTGSAPICTAKYAIAPDGTLTATRLQLSLNGGSAAADRSGVAQTVAATTQATSYKGVIWLKATTPADVGKTVLLRHVGGTNYYPCVLTADWKAFERVEAAAASYGVFVLGLRGASGGASNSVDFLVWGADLRAVSDGVGLPPYQRVVDANTYDTTSFPPYLKFDGVDDFLQTATVDFRGTDKLFATAALRKLDDSAAGIVVELSSVSNTSNGSFALLAPAGSNDTLAVYMRGATTLTTSVPSGIPSPASRVFTGVMDTSAAVGMQSRSRLNGDHSAYASQGSGGGNFGAYPLYIGRRGGAGLPFNGRLYGLVIRSNFTSEAQLAAVERCLNLKGKVY